MAELCPYLKYDRERITEGTCSHEINSRYDIPTYAIVNERPLTNLPVNQVWKLLDITHQPFCEAAIEYRRLSNLPKEELIKRIANFQEGCLHNPFHIQITMGYSTL